jgi:predicted metal-dependent peptidase
MQNFNKAPGDKLYINFSNVPDSNVTKDAGTRAANGEAYTAFNIYLNDLALANASQEYIAGTIAHEVLHAYIDNEIAPGSGKTNKELEAMGHEEMSTNYVKPLASMLNKLYLMPMEDAIALAWGGLSGTKAWKEMIAKDNQNNTGETGKIDEINKRYKNLNNAYGDQAKGTKCK